MVYPSGDLARYRFGAASADVLAVLRGAVPVLGTFMVLCGWATAGFLCSADDPVLLILDGVVLTAALGLILDGVVLAAALGLILDGVVLTAAEGLVSTGGPGVFAVLQASAADTGSGFFDS